MDLRVFLCVLVGAIALRFVPGLMLRLVLALPSERVAFAARLLHHASGVFQFHPERDTHRPASLPMKAVVISTSLVALLTLLTTAFLEWHPAGLTMLLH